MTTWVALLRAVNLGPTNKLAMADLRALLISLGYEDVRTHLQSGNAVFTASAKNAADVERAIERELRAKGMGPSVRAIVLGARDLATVVDRNPFAEGDTKHVHVVFLAAEVEPVDTSRYAPNELAFGDRAVYVRLPDGVQAAKLPDWQRVLGVPGTMRTWRTVTRLNELANAPA